MEMVRRNRVAIGARLKEARENAGVSMEEAAEAAGAQVAAISAWERGRSLPSLIQYRDLLACYGVAGHRILFDHSPFELTQEQARELRLASHHFSPSLQTRVNVWVTVMERYRDSASRIPAS
jgi:transcriptional regulator with XRE-family HTH domain